MVQVSNSITNEYVEIWKSDKEYIPVFINNHGNDANMWVIDEIVKLTYRHQGNGEMGTVLKTNWWSGKWINKGSNIALSLRSDAIILIQYFYSEAQSELYCGVVVNGERGKVRDMELENIRIIECPDVKEVSDAINELESKNYYYDKWFYPYTPWVVALAKKLYGIQL